MPASSKSSSHQTSVEGAWERIRAEGLRLTGPRQALMDLLIRDHGPFTIDGIHQKLKKQRCDLVTVYRCLAQFEKIGLVKRCDFGDGIVRYEYAEPGEHHHHIICRKCRKVTEFEDCFLEDVETRLKRKGFSDISHNLEFFGICDKC